MVSCDLLEKPGAWRWMLIGLGLGVTLAPAAGVLLAAYPAGADVSGSPLDGGYYAAVGRSLRVALGVAGTALALGLPAGLVAGRYDFPGRRVLLPALALPLLLPSFLSAIGLSRLRIALHLPADGWWSGYWGVVWAFATFVTPLVLFTTLAAARNISRSQLDAARLAGGERHVLWHSARQAGPVAGLTALLGGALTLSDPGPGQILGHRGAASEILATFAAQYDFALAARQCLVLAGWVVAVSLPVILLLAPRLATGLLARDVAPAPLRKLGLPRAAEGPRMRERLFPWLASGGLAGLVGCALVAPALGFVVALGPAPPWATAWERVLETFGDTLVYGAGAGVIATMLGCGLALAAGRFPGPRVLLLAGLLLTLALPPALSALGFVHWATVAPAAWDPLLRGRGVVCLSLGLRLTPLAALLALRGVGTMPPSWAWAAALHGVSLGRYGIRVLLPWLRGALLAAGVLIALLAVADVGTTLLLHPPGHASLPLALFTVMANAPEPLVSLLCLFYLGGAALLLGGGIGLGGRGLRKP